MAKTDVERLIAHRISGQNGGRKGAMIGVARISVGLSVAVMLISLSVIVGFKEALHKELTGMEAHISVEPAGSYLSLDVKPLVRNAEFEEIVGGMEHFGSLSPFASRAGIIRHDGTMQGALLRGVAPGYDSLYFASKLTEGSLPRISAEERKKDILISATLANMLEVGVGDKIEFVFTSPSAPIRRDSYKISGIYSMGLSSMERNLTLTDIRNVQRLAGWSEEQVTGYMVMADEFDNMEELAGNVRAEAYLSGGEELWRTTDLKSNYPQIFDWLATHNINGAVIIIIMFAVALLNMISALLIIIFERIRTIGTLKALGMRNRGVQHIFLWCGLRVLLVGQFWGNIAAALLLALQHYTGIVTLDPDGYMLSTVPVAFDWSWWVGLNLLIPLLLTLLLTIPVAVTSRIKPDQTLKYQ